MTTAARLMTADEFDLLPEPRNGGKHELVNGEVVTHMPVTADHGEIQAGLRELFRAFTKPRQLGKVLVETGFRLEQSEELPNIVRGPDVSFIARDRLPPRENLERRSVPVPPDLAVEVTSPNDRDSEVHDKVLEYQRAGVPRVWVVRPDARTVTVHLLDGSSQEYGAGAVLTSAEAGFAEPGFELPVEAIFELDAE